MNHSAANTGPTVDEVWRWLEAVPDPEIPVLSVIDLGIIRDVEWRDGQLIVVMTPTYSGCPALEVIHDAICDAIRANGVTDYQVQTRLSPAWTTDWLSTRGRQKLTEYGIAPPSSVAGEQMIDISRISRASAEAERPACPHCGAARTTRISQFGSTPCKAHYRCLDCLEPFDYFKPH